MRLQLVCEILKLMVKEKSVIIIKFWVHSLVKLYLFMIEIITKSWCFLTLLIFVAAFLILHLSSLTIAH